MQPAVIVVGGINHDLVLSVQRGPALGETILASGIAHFPGGKGGNQAAAAARAGAATALVGAVGDDANGAAELAALTQAGVAVTEVAQLAGQPTGLAVITVTPAGENSIIVVPGANARMDASELVASLQRLCTPRCIVVLQTELPLAIIEAAARFCIAQGLRVVLNNAPCVQLGSDTRRACDPLVVNETEAAQMMDTDAPEAPQALARALLESSGAKSVVVTLGARGCVWLDASGSGLVPARKVKVVDTTGAGDTFIGTLAASLAQGGSLAQACAQGSEAGALAVTWKGARPG